MALEHLFDAEPQYQPGMEPLADEGDGDLLGSGGGTVSGRVVAGKIHWTLFEQPGELVCAMLNVPDSVAARLLARLGVSLASAQATLAARRDAL